MIDDGTYDVLIVDADTDGGALRLEVTVLAGDHKGEIVALTTTGITRDPLDLLAVPGTLVVTAGVPDLTLEG